jgi:hypothetical protein
LAAGSPAGAVLADARLLEGRAILAAPGDQSAARPIILDNAGPSDAAELSDWAGRIRRNGGQIGLTPRFVLVGGPFDADGAIPVLEAGPFNLFEAGRASTRRLWLRGGYPEAYGAASDEAAAEWLECHAADLAYGALASSGLPREPRLIAGLLEAVAATHGDGLNENAVARALGISRPTVVRYVGLLERAGILFSVPSLPVALPSVARSTRSRALYVRDSGLLHALVGIRSPDDLAMKPGLAAASWAGFVVEQAREGLPPGVALYRYASADGAALDLVATKNGKPFLAAAARRHRPTSVERSISYAARAILGDGGSRDRLIVAPDGDGAALTGGFAVTNLGAFLDRLAGA